MTPERLRRGVEEFFTGEERERAAGSLHSYCNGKLNDPEKSPRFSGAGFEWLIDRENPDRITERDLLAVTMLRVAVPPRAALWILGDGQQEVSDLLVEIGPDRPIWEAEDDELVEDAPAERLWRRLKRFDELGSVIAGKLVAAKRPSLIPIWDQHVDEALGPPPHGFWLGVRNSLRECHHLVEEVIAYVGVELTVLRAVDIVVWMRQYGYKFDDALGPWPPLPEPA